MPTELGDFHSSDKLNRNFDYYMKECVKAVEDGLPPKDACVGIIGIDRTGYYRWVRWVESDLAEGFDETDSKLIKFILALAKADVNLHRRLAEKGVELALSGDSQMLKFLLATRYGYSEKKDVEVSTKDDALLELNIVPMTGNEEDE